MAKKDESSAPLPANRDDFRQIKGIGQAIAQALYEVGILRYADLANTTPEALVNLLRGRVPLISVQRIQRDRWIEQAGELANQPEPVDDPPEDGRTPVAGSGRESWKELADFFVSFGETLDSGGEARKKTRVHYSQTDKDMEFEGIVSDELVRWMLSQANLQPTRRPPTQAEESSTAPEVTTKDEGVTAGQAEAEQTAPAESDYPPAGDLPGGALPSDGILPIQGTPQAGESLQPAISNIWVTYVEMPGERHSLYPQRMVRVKANIHFPMVDTAMLAAYPTSFGVDILLVNTDTNVTTFFEAASIPLSTETLPYEFQIDFPVPPPARYQLYLIARTNPPGQTYALEQGPIVRVGR